ncbi:MAG: peptidase C45 [Acidobacteria bacterium]|nr:peptidase C45 [Acidobacteriota bacterium]
MEGTLVRTLILATAATALWAAGPVRDLASHPRLGKGWRGEIRNGWIPVHLEGPPAQLGFQNGYLLAEETEDLFRTVVKSTQHDARKKWAFYRTAAQHILWPRIEAEYREELQGIVDGLAARGARLDLWDVVALNAFLELVPYYTPWYQRNKGRRNAFIPLPERCSAFVATGSYTRDGRPVIAHNAWTDYHVGSRWNIIFDVAPARGHRFIMDGLPGVIHSGDDFGINAAGIMITETTISAFRGFDPNGIAEFVRARKAMQYSSSIDDFDRIMRQGNNGGYANNWLVADSKTGEIASLELGLRNVILKRTRDGYFAGANFPVDEKLRAEETDFDPNNTGNSANARRARWDQLMAKHKGSIDTMLARQFLADHFDTHDRREQPNERTLCGHIDLSPRGLRGWQYRHGPAGAVQNKVADAAMAGRLALDAAMGHACGRNFDAADHLAKYRRFRWQKDILRDLPASPWTTFEAAPANP